MKDIVVDLRKDRVKIAGGSRDRAITLTPLYTGVRVSELYSIKVRNIDLLTGHLRVVDKGGKIREMPLKLEVIEVIKEYLIIRAYFIKRNFVSAAKKVVSSFVHFLSIEMGISLMQRILIALRNTLEEVGVGHQK